jgi:hypothetical protein
MKREQEQLEQASSFHRSGEAKPYSSFDSSLQLWRGEQLRKYYAELEEPTYRRRSTKPTELRSSIDFFERLQGLGIKLKR